MKKTQRRSKMRTLSPLFLCLLFGIQVHANTAQTQPQDRSVTQWHAVYQTTLKTNSKSALTMLQNRYHTVNSISEKLYVSGLIYEYMTNIKQPYYGSSQTIKNPFSELESKYILALNERKHGSYEASVDRFITLRNEMKNISDIDSQALMSYQLCYTLNQQGRYDNAHFFCSSLENHLQQQRQESVPIDLALRVIANNYNFRGENEKALSVYQHLLEVMPAQSDASGVYNDVGNLFAELGQFEQSDKYLIQALLARQANEEQLKVAQTEHSLAAMYSKANYFEKAITHYQNSLMLLEQLNYPYGQGLVYLGLASAMAEVGKLEESVSYIDAALGLGERHENMHLQTEAHLTAGFSYLKHNDIANAIRHGQKALTIATEISRPLLQAKAERLLADAYSANQNYKMALLHSESYTKLELASRDASTSKALEALSLSKNEYEFELQRIRLNNERRLQQSEFKKLTEQKRAYNILVFCLITLLILALLVQRQTKNKARLDSLTCALNRATTIKTIKEQTTHAKADRRYVLVLIDLDNFKAINDTYGHPTGDLVLQQVCSSIAAQLNKGECIGRLGGEEFIVLLTNVDDVEVAFRVQSLHKTISEQTINVGKSETEEKKAVTVSASLAYLSTSKPLTNFDELYTILDQALYQAKHNSSGTIIEAYDEPISLETSAFESTMP